MKFEVYEQYLAGQQANAQKSSQLQERVTETEQQYKSLLAEWETTMALSFKTGKDVTKTIEQLDEKIDKAKREMERATRERDVYSRVQREVSFTAEDVIVAWNRELSPLYYEKEIAPALEHLEDAKKAYNDAMCSYFKKVHDIEGFREEVSNQLGFEFPYRFHIKDLTTTAEFERYFITQQDTDKARNGRN